MVTVVGRFCEPRTHSGLAQSPYNSRSIFICNRDAFNLAGRDSVEPRHCPDSARQSLALPGETQSSCVELRTNYLGSTMVAPFVKYWIPVVGWMLLIFLASGDLMSAEHTSRFLVPFLLWLKPDISAGALIEIHFCIRKAAHVTEYAILALFVCRAVFRGANVKAARSILFVGAWIACAVVATCDEFRQSFVESRGASPWDVMIDSAGAILGLLIYARFAHRKTVAKVGFPKSGIHDPK